MPADLEELVADVQRAVDAVRSAEAEHAYRLALLARAAISRRSANQFAAMEVCARRVGVARTTLHAFAVIAARWQLSDLRALFLRRDSEGRALSSTHLLLVGRLPRAARDRWIERVLSQGLDVRALKAAMREASELRAEEGGNNSPSSALVVLNGSTN